MIPRWQRSAYFAEALSCSVRFAIWEQSVLGIIRKSRLFFVSQYITLRKCFRISYNLICWIHQYSGFCQHHVTWDSWPFPKRSPYAESQFGKLISLLHGKVLSLTPANLDFQEVKSLSQIYEIGIWSNFLNRLITDWCFQTAKNHPCSAQPQHSHLQGFREQFSIRVARLSRSFLFSNYDKYRLVFESVQNSVQFHFFPFSITTFEHMLGSSTNTGGSAFLLGKAFFTAECFAYYPLCLVLLITGSINTKSGPVKKYRSSL